MEFSWDEGSQTVEDENSMSVGHRRKEKSLFVGDRGKEKSVFVGGPGDILEGNLPSDGDRRGKKPLLVNDRGDKGLISSEKKFRRVRWQLCNWVAARLDTADADSLDKHKHSLSWDGENSLFVGDGQHENSLSSGDRNDKKSLFDGDRGDEDLPVLPQQKLSNNKRKICCIIDTPILIDDGHTWRQKRLPTFPKSKHHRKFCWCIHSDYYGCQALKQVQRIADHPPEYRITYFGHHTCPSSQLLLDTTDVNMPRPSQ